MGADYRVRYAKSVLEFMRNGIQTRKAYDRVDSYRMILALFPEAGAVYDPYYEAVRPSVKGARKVPGLGLQRLEVLLDLIAGVLAGEVGPHLQLAAEGDGGHASGAGLHRRI